MFQISFFLRLLCMVVLILKKKTHYELRIVSTKDYLDAEQIILSRHKRRYEKGVS